MSKEVKRYVPEYCESGGEIWAEMQEDSEGGWVRAVDYEALLAERDAILLQARIWAGEAKTQKATVDDVGRILGGVPDWGPIAAGVEQLKKDAERYRWLRQRLVGASFDWDDEGMTVMAFEMPDGVSIGADCDKNIDSAMQGEQP